MTVNGYNGGTMPTLTTPLPLAAASERVKGCCQPVPALLSAQRAEGIADIHRALSDPMRVQLVHILKEAAQPVCVCDFAAALPLSQPTISHHLAKLRTAGIVVSHRRGIWAFYELDPRMSAAARAAVDLVA